MQKRWNVPKIWQGSRCFIIGGGPSLVDQFQIPQDVVNGVRSRRNSISTYSSFLSSIHDEKIIGVNMAYQLGNWVDICFFGDYGFWRKQSRSLQNFQGLTISCEKKVPAHWVKFLAKDKQKEYGVSSKNGFISWNKNSGASAINLAIHLGVKQIILLGFDMTLDEGNNQHWHKAYHSNIRTVKGTMRSHLKGFPAIAADAKKMGVEILNASLHSRIQEFEKIEVLNFVKKLDR